MHTHFDFEEAMTYDAAVSSHYASEDVRLLSLTQNLIHYLQKNTDLMKQLEMGGLTDYYEILILLLKASNVIHPPQSKDIFGRYKINKDERARTSRLLVSLAEKLTHMPCYLNDEEKQIFEDCMVLFIPNDVAVKPQRNYKHNVISDLKKDNLTVNFLEEESLVELPRDFELLGKSIKMFLECGCDLEAVYQKNAINLFNKIKSDLESTDKLGEIIIVPDGWEKDAEICAGVVIRDKAHQQRNGYAILLTASELELLIESKKINQLPLHNIYKISTLMHNSDFKFNLYEKINKLVSSCCSSEDCHLQEITLRQCFSAGDRPAMEPELSVARAPNYPSPTKDELAIVDNILKHTINYNEPTLKALKADFYELQTRPANPLETEHFVSLERPLAILAHIIRDNSLAQAKAPHLLIKGYYGPVSPSPEGADAVFMRPARQRAGSDTQLPLRFYKATRVNPFKMEIEQPIDDHQARKGGRRNP